MDRLELPNFNSKAEELKFISDNVYKLMHQKKAIIKQADGFAFVMPDTSLKGLVNVVDKARPGAVPNLETLEALKVEAIINTTNLLDSHNDVHIPGIWDKSLRENKMLMHVQEHKSHSFAAIIADGEDLKGSVKTYTWKELGFNYEGSTQALHFDSKVLKSRNAYMFGEYGKGHVKNHSVGMRYTKLLLAIGDKDIASAEQYENYEKYIEQIANRKAAEAKGWFWVVLEAKAIEGSAVPLGSNTVTPTHSVEAASKHSTEGDEQKALEAAKALQARKNMYNL